MSNHFNLVALTLDVDWAPDFVIDWVAERLIASKVSATWFVTHASPAIERLRRFPHLFELGIHPNFLPGSSHGATPDEVLSYCLGIVPGALSSRTHGLVQSSLLLEQFLCCTPVRVDLSLFLPRTPYLRPVSYRWRGRTLIRIPVFWEDDFEMGQEEPCWHLDHYLALGEGLKVFSFHPMHLYLNSSTPGPYRELKGQVSHLTALTPALASSYIQEQEGAYTLLKELISYVQQSPPSVTAREIARRWDHGQPDQCQSSS